MFKKLFGKKDVKETARASVSSTKIERSTEAVMELEVEKKRLQMEVEQIKLELDNQKKRETMKLEEEAHKHKLKLQEEKAVFEREKKVWEVEKKELADRYAREKVEFEGKVKQEFELKTQEAVTLTKLDSQQKVKQAEIDSERKINALQTKHADDLAKVRAETAEEHYKKLTAAFQEMQLHGDKNTKFVQELALKVFEKVPTPRAEFGVDINTPQLTASKEA
jgi:hypothetical protein